MTQVKLMCMNRTVLTAEYDYEVNSFFRIDAVDLESHVPFGARKNGGKLTKGGLQSWWSDRAIPFSREDFDKIRRSLGGVGPIGLLSRAYGLSLSDQFWLKPEDSPVNWEDVNYFDNGFSGALGLMTLEGVPGSFRLPEGFAPSDIGPSSSSGGDLRKAWILRDGQRLLLKAGSAPFRQQPFNECVASALYERVMPDSDFVPYALESLRSGEPVCACPCMVDRDECFVPAYEIRGMAKRRNDQSEWMFLNELYAHLGIEDGGLQLSRMFALDYILANSDRHLNNFGIIFDAESMRAKRVAPIFDTGNSLWFDKPALDFNVDFRYRPKPLIADRARGVTPEDQLAVVDDFSWFDSTRLVGFEKAAVRILGGDSALSASRLRAIENGIGRNMDYLEDMVSKKGMKRGGARCVVPVAKVQMSHVRADSETSGKRIK